MADAIQEMFRSLSFVITASLIPKKEITRSLSDMRPISGWCHFRKWLGSCGWTLSHLCNGWHTRVAELARAWASPVYVGQVDLRQASDKIKQSAVIDALLEKQVPTQLIAVLVACWSQSEVSVRRQSVSSHRMQRGVPQGAPESPLVFVMTTDCALGSLLSRWLRQMQVGPLTLLWVGYGCLVWLLPMIFGLCQDRTDSHPNDRRMLR